MAYNTAGLLYFPLSMKFWKDSKIITLRKEINEIAPQRYLQILTEIYDNGYFLEFTKENIYSISDTYHIEVDEIKKIVEKCIEVGLFNKELFEKYNILTSKSIQKIFLDAGKSRIKIELINEYLLINFAEIYEFITRDRLKVYIYSFDKTNCIILYKSLEINVDKLATMTFKDLINYALSDKFNALPDIDGEKSGIFDKRKESKVKERKVKESEAKNLSPDTLTHNSFFQRWIKEKSIHLKKLTPISEEQENILLNRVDKYTLIQIASELDDKMETGYKVGKLFTALNKFTDQYLKGRK